MIACALLPVASAAAVVFIVGLIVGAAAAMIHAADTRL